MGGRSDARRRRAAYLRVAGTALGVLATVLALGLQLGSRTHGAAAYRATAYRATAHQATALSALPPIRHVFVVNLENKGFAQTWGTHSRAPYLARTLRAKGLLLTQYYGVAHHSLGNYVAQISGQGPDHATQQDCPVYSRFTRTGSTRAPGQVVGNGCVYPTTVDTLPGQLTRAGLTWRGYMEDLATPCQHSVLGARERWAAQTRREQYVSRHDPFVYFRSITSRTTYCRGHVKPLSALTRDLASAAATRNLSYITPDLCHDAHDATCLGNDGVGGLRGANEWLHTWVPRILQSPAFVHDGLLVITADESDGPTQDSRACCGEGPGPNAAHPGIDGPGGGRVGALVISPFITPGGTSSRAYNHYSLLGSIEDLLGLPRLGYARTVTHVFGPDVYTNP